MKPVRMVGIEGGEAAEGSGDHASGANIWHVTNSSKQLQPGLLTPKLLIPINSDIATQLYYTSKTNTHMAAPSGSGVSPKSARSMSCF